MTQQFTDTLELPYPDGTSAANVPLDIEALAQALDERAAALFPSPGDIKMTAANAAPAGWLFCDGSEIDRVEFAALYTAIGTTYGPGDGAATFNLPDLRTRVPLGAGLTRPLGQKGGEESHALTAAELATHKHTVADPGHGHGVSDPTHAHTVADPGHGHGIADPGHMHITQAAGNSLKVAAWTSGNSYNVPGVGQTWTDQRLINITGVQGAYTGVGIYGSATGIGVNPGPSGVAVNDAGGGQAHNNMPPFQVVLYVIKT